MAMGQCSARDRSYKQYALTLLIHAGVRVLCLQDSERALESHTDKLLVSVLPVPVTLSAQGAAAHVRRNAANRGAMCWRTGDSTGSGASVNRGAAEVEGCGRAITL
jgi:hypothetical protein